MDKNHAAHMWRRLLLALCGAGPSSHVCLRHPGNVMTEAVKAGKYDALTDEEYNALLADTNEESALYGGKATASADDVLIAALRATKLSHAEIVPIARALAEASARTDYTTAVKTKPLSVSGVPPDVTPRDIYNIIDGGISGQEDAKQAAALIVYNHLNHRKRNALFAGPTGCGKSEIWRVLAKSFPCIKIFDGSMLCADGWKGSLYVRSIFEAYTEADRESAIIVIDEADKLLEPAIASGGWDTSLKVQNNLLKMMDGDVLTFEGEDKKVPFSVDCSGVSVIMLGAFETMLKSRGFSRKMGIGFGSSSPDPADDTDSAPITTEDLITHGNMRREIAGRIHSVTVMTKMDENAFMRLLEDPSVSPAAKLAEQYHIDIQLSDSFKVKLAKEAVTSKLGVRWIRSNIQQIIDKHIFADPGIKSLYLNVPEHEHDHYLPFL